MGSWSLRDVVDKIQVYEKMLIEAGYVHSGPGIKPWSHRHSHPDGTAIEIRGSGWTLYDKDGKETLAGNVPNDLRVKLLSKLSKEELINLIIK